MKDTELFNVEDDYIKISDLIMMLWRHKYPIIAFTLIVTLVVGLVLFAQPRKFEASVVMRSTGAEDVIQSHLVIGKSSLVAKRVHEELAGTGSDYPLYKLMNAVTVSRSGKTDVLNCRAVTLSPEDSRAIAELWSSEMIKESRSKSEERALNYVRNKIKADEEELVRGLAVL
ncbi:MAG: hypothetical protein GX811_11585 [Lentisphaerae bacterium]|nr:hypothetical protein [Lentisphaerota bacterium]